MGREQHSEGHLFFTKLLGSTRSYPALQCLPLAVPWAEPHRWWGGTTSTQQVIWVVVPRNKSTPEIKHFLAVCF